MKLINLFVSLLRGPSTHLSEKINTMSLQFDVSKYIIAQIYHCCCLSADLRALFLFFLIKFAPATQRTKIFAHPFFIQVAPMFVYLPGLPTGDLWPQETQLRGREKCSGDRPTRGRQSGFILRLALSASPALLKRTGPLNIPCKAFPGSSGLGRCSHRLGRRPMTWLPTSTESIFKVNYRVQCL